MTSLSVAVGIVFNAEGKILVATRLDKYFAGQWEFPGGKQEPNEPIITTLKRELWEEVGIEVLACESWMIVEHDYPHKRVCLQVHKVIEYKGEAWGREGQKIQWVSLQELLTLPVPPANEKIIKALLD